MLDLYTSNFINDSNNVYINNQSNEITLNPIFKWYKNDFKKHGGIIKFIKMYKQDFPNSLTQPKLSYFKYDWSLNKS